MKRMISLFLVLALALSLLPMSALAANSAKASTLRMGNTSGTVSVTNASGKKVSAGAGARLYSGYSVATGKGSNAYVTLDSAKAAKLDASSKAGVRQSANKLELYLASGKLYFNVSKPLKSNASMNIRTSTMVAGIRGTIGWVTPTAIGILEGHVTLTCINPVTGEIRTTEVQAGEMVYYEFETTQSGQPDLLQIDFVKRLIENSDIPAFVVEELRNDESVRDRVIKATEGTHVDVPALLEDYEDKVAREAAVIEALEADILERLAKQDEFISNSPVEYFFKDTGDGGGGGGGGGGTYAVTVTSPARYVLTGALDSGGAVTPTDNADGSQTYQVPNGDSLSFALDTTGFYVDGAAQVNLDGAALAAPYTVTAAGTVSTNNVYYEIDSATIDTLFDALNTYGSVAYNDGTAGTLTVSGHVQGGQTLMITAGSNFIVGAGASLTVDEDGDLKNDGTLTNNGTFVNNSSHTVYNNAGATLDNAGTLTNNGRIVNAGTLTNNNDMTVSAGATIENNGTVTNNDDFQNSGTVTNFGTFNNAAGTLTNNGTVSSEGTTTNGGTVTGQADGITATLTGGALTLTGTGSLDSKEVWSAFDGTVNNLVIAGGITTIGAGTFQGCTGLTTVTIPASVTSIGANAFANCSLTGATFEGSKPSMGSGAFDGNDQDFTIFYDYNQAGWYDNLSLDENTIDGYNAVSCARGTCGENLNYTIYTEGKYDEEASAHGGELHADEDEEADNGSSAATPACWLEITGTGAMDNYDIYSGEFAPWSGQKLVRVELPKGLTSIGSEAFYQCDVLTDIELPADVTSIGKSAFDGCSSLVSIKMPEKLTCIGEYAFFECFALTSISIPDGVTDIGKSAFYWCKSLTDMIVPAGVTEINESVFDHCVALKSVTLEGDVISIGKQAFIECNSLTSINIPASVTSIGEQAFRYCKELTAIDLPAGLENLGEEAFKGCWSLTSITIPTKITVIPDSLMMECPGLTEVHFRGNVTAIGNTAFAYCHSLPSIELPETVISIGNDAFKGCKALYDISLPPLVTSVPSSLFDGCTSLTSYTIPDTVTSIGQYAFYGCSNLESLTIPSSVTEIGGYAFANCSKLTSLTIPNGVEIIYGYMFEGCSSLTSLTIPSSVAKINNYTFRDCFVEEGAEISYGKTMADWNSLVKSLTEWDTAALSRVTIKCSDGRILPQTNP